jgi:8-oxo-dGTP diphosphatase
VWKGDLLLLGKRIHSDGEDCWQLPGGHLEVGETVTECALREVREETGLEVNGLTHAGFTEEMFSTVDRDYVTLFVSAKYISGDAIVMEAEKCRCWDWFRYDDLPSPLFAPIINVLKQVSDLSELRYDQGAQVSAHK